MIFFFTIGWDLRFICEPKRSVLYYKYSETVYRGKTRFGQVSKPLVPWKWRIFIWTQILMMKAKKNSMKRNAAPICMQFVCIRFRRKKSSKTKFLFYIIFYSSMFSWFVTIDLCSSSLVDLGLGGRGARDNGPWLPLKPKKGGMFWPPTPPSPRNSDQKVAILIENYLQASLAILIDLKFSKNA